MNTIEENKKPFFIFIEGADGVGKSTTSALLKQILQEQYKKNVDQESIMQFTEIGTSIRNIGITDDTVSDELKFLGYCFSTFYGLDKLNKAKQEQDFVIVDRSHASTYAQSICASRASEKTKTCMIRIFNDINTKFNIDFKDRYLFVNLTASVDGALERLYGDRGEFDVLEKRGKGYQELIKEGYRAFFLHHVRKKELLSIDTEANNQHEVVADIVECLIQKGKL